MVAPFNNERKQTMTQIEKMLKAQDDWQAIFNALVDAVNGGVQ